MGDPHVLFCAFAEVPGASAVGTRVGQWLSVFGNREVDALTLKGREAAHIQRLGGARMMRVPNTSGKPFLERLSTYQRALQRQLSSDQYELIWCGDLFSGAVVASALKEKVPIVLEIGEVPSQTLAGRALVGEDTAVTQKRWRDQERAAIKAAAKVLLPSRHAAKLLSERIDARFLQVVPRTVDRTVFVPPSIEVSLEDERRVLIFGGREGGRALAAAVAVAHAVAVRVPANVSIGLLGQPSLADAEVRAALAKKNLVSRVELVDADGPLAVTAALSLAHVVVVPSSAEEDAEPFGLPHRALEAMSCGRAVVVTGPDAAFRDAATPGEHFVCTAAKDPATAADAVVTLLEEGVLRDTLSRNAARHIERTADLSVRAGEVLAMIAEATKVQLRMHAPRSDDPDTSSRSQPPSPSALGKAAEAAARGPGGVASSFSTPARSNPQNMAPTPVASPSSSLNAPSRSNPQNAAAAPASSSSSSSSSSLKAPSRSNPELRAPELKAPARSNPQNMAPTPVASPIPQRSSASGPNPLATTAGAMQTVRMEMPQFSDAPGMWEGDTFLDGNLPPAMETSPDAAGVRGAMLVSSDAQSKAESSVPTSPPTSVPSGAPTSNPGSVPTSIIVQAALDSKPPSSPSDPWAPDTIADGTPIEPTRGADASVFHRGPSSTPQKPRASFLVDAAQKEQPLSAADDDDATGDLTAEDAPLPSASSSED